MIQHDSTHKPFSVQKLHQLFNKTECLPWTVTTHKSSWYTSACVCDITTCAPALEEDTAWTATASKTRIRSKPSVQADQSRLKSTQGCTWLPCVKQNQMNTILTGNHRVILTQNGRWQEDEEHQADSSGQVVVHSADKLCDVIYLLQWVNENIL